MGKLKELRDQLVADLAVLGVPILDEWMVRTEPPCVFLTPPLSEPYVTAGREIGSYVLNIDAVVLVLHRPPDEGREQLELLLEDLLRNTVDWAMKGVESPSTASMTDNTFEFLGTVVHLGKTLSL